MAKAIKSPKILAQFRLDFPHCWACGVPEHLAPWPGLQTHHIIKPGRSDERANLSRLCQQCHDLAEFHTIRRDDNGLPWPWLMLPYVLWLKKHRDPDNYNRARLQDLYGKALPRASKPPLVFLREWTSHQGSAA